MRPRSGVWYIYARSRSRLELAEQLAKYQGVLQIDGYGDYKHLAEPEREAAPIQLAFCLAHLRRRSFRSSSS